MDNPAPFGVAMTKGTPPDYFVDLIVRPKHFVEDGLHIVAHVRTNMREEAAGFVQQLTE